MNLAIFIRIACLELLFGLSFGLRDGDSDEFRHGNATNAIQPTNTPLLVTTTNDKKKLLVNNGRATIVKPKTWGLTCSHTPGAKAVFIGAHGGFDWIKQAKGIVPKKRKLLAWKRPKPISSRYKVEFFTLDGTLLSAQLADYKMMHFEAAEEFPPDNLILVQYGPGEIKTAKRDVFNKYIDRVLKERQKAYDLRDSANQRAFDDWKQDKSQSLNTILENIGKSAVFRENVQPGRIFLNYELGFDGGSARKHLEQHQQMENTFGSEYYYPDVDYCLVSGSGTSKKLLVDLLPNIERKIQSIDQHFQRYATVGFSHCRVGTLDGKKMSEEAAFAAAYRWLWGKEHDKKKGNNLKKQSAAFSKIN